MPDTANPLADLILVRLLKPGKNPPAPSTVLKDLAPLFRGGVTKDRITGLLSEFRQAGLLPPKGQALTEAGRSRALAYLGLAELPPKCNWGMIKAKFLVPKALGLTPWSEAEVARVGTADKLAARLLKTKYDLPVSADVNLSGVLEALVCKLAGFAGCSNLKELSAAVLSRELQADPPLPVKDAAKVAPRLLLGATKSGVDGYRMTVLSGSFEDRVEPPLAAPVAPEVSVPPLAPVASTELQIFAERVNALAPSCPTGWSGDDLVLISHVWNHVRPDPAFQASDLAAFKENLLAANRERLLALSRADLVQALDPADVRESETVHLNAVFHFLKIRKGN